MGQQSGLERVSYKFLGHVQHRGFRYACVICAERAGATGWVRNERDGTVTAEVQGTKEAQLSFVKRLTTLVPGYGDGWTIAREKPMSLVDEEPTFCVRRA